MTLTELRYFVALAETDLAVRPLTDPAPQYCIALAWRVSYLRSEAIDILIDAPRSQ